MGWGADISGREWVLAGAVPVGESSGRDRRGPPPMVGESPAMRRVRREIALYGPEDATVLVLGETGTGKEIAARQLHAASARSGAP